MITNTYSIILTLGPNFNQFLAVLNTLTVYILFLLSAHITILPLAFNIGNIIHTCAYPKEPYMIGDNYFPINGTY